MRVLVLGAGGIGGYFGGRLVQAGADVTFLVREARAARLRAEGLVIESPLGDATIEVKTATAAESAYDLVLLSCKAFDLEGAIEVVRPGIGPVTSILPLLNGLAHMERLDAAFGGESVLGGLALVSATMAPDGRIRHLGKMQSITVGARSDGQRARCDAVERLLATASFDLRRSPAIMQDLWEKFAFITAAAGITCLMRANVGAIVAAGDGERLTRQILGECEAVAAAAGFPIAETAQAWARQLLLQPGSAFTTSMLRDVQSGAKIEADHLQGDMIRRGDALGVDVDLLRIAYCHLQAYQNGRGEA